MKPCSIIFIIATFITSSEANSSTLNFTHFLKVFKEKNPDLISAQNQAYATQLRSNSIYSLLIPTLNYGISELKTQPIPSPLLNYDLSKTKVQSVGINGNIPQLGMSYASNLYSLSDSRFFDGNDKTSESISGLVDFGLSMKLLKGFGPSVGSIPFEQADLNKKISNLQKKNTLLTGVGRLIEAYNNVFASLNNLKISKSILQSNDNDVKKAEKQHKEGLIPYLSLLTLKSQNTGLKKNIINQMRSLRDNILSLYNLTGEKWEISEIEAIEITRIEMPDEFQNKINQWLEPGKVDPTKTNPEILIKKSNLTLSELDLNKARNNILPDLSLNAKYTKNSDRRGDYFPNKGDSQELSINFTMPIGMVSERAEASAKSLELKAKQNDLEVSLLRVKQDWDNLGQQFKLSLEQLSMAKELVEVAKKQYDSALPTATLGPTYQANIINFQNQLLTAQLDLNQSEAELLNLMIKIYVIKGDATFIRFLDK
jgi:outer membrane protein TolC